jgi:hypothetical protein
MLGIYLTESSSGGSYRIEGRVVVIGPDDKIRNPSDMECDQGGYCDLMIDCLGNEEHKEQGVYSWSVGYRSPYDVDLRRAEIMVKTLRAIERKMDRIKSSLGPPESFGAFVGRAAAVIGAQRFVFLRGKSRGWSYDDSKHSIQEVEIGIFKVNEMILIWRDPPKAEPEETTEDRMSAAQEECERPEESR